MKKTILIIIISFFYLGFNYSFSVDNNYLEYAEIPNTDIINMNGQINGNSYRVYIDTGSIFYITGSDNQLHNCFKIEGTGYTEKLGEIYFQYEGNGSYICNDYKLRGVFKIGAGGWGYMEDLENNPEKWKNFLDKIKTNGYYYHNADNNGNGTGQAFIDGIGFSNWDTVSTKFDLQQAFSNISISSSVISNNINANGTSTGNFWIQVKYEGTKLKNFKVDKIYFLSGYDSDVILNGKKIPALKYTGPLTTDNYGYIKGYVSSLNGNKDLKYGLAVKILDNIVKYEGTTSKFKYPFSINIDLKSKDIVNKILVGYTNQAKLSKILNNIDSIQFINSTNKIKYGAYNDYFITNTGNNISIDGNYHDIKISYKKFFQNDKIDIYYNITGDYNFTKNGENYLVKNFSINSNTGSVYKNGKIDSINISRINDLSVSADGKTENIYQITFLDKDEFKINNLDYDLNMEDIDKSFNLNLDNNYRTGFFINKNYISSLGDYKVGIISYKPVNDTKLKFNIKNINYNGYYNFLNSDKTIQVNNIDFSSVVDSIFQNKILKINRDDSIKYEIYNNLGNSSINNLSFIYTGYADCNGSLCSDVNFVKGKFLSGTNFQDYNFNIRINSSTSPSAIIYSGYLSYDLSGNYGSKKVHIKQQKKYSPLLFIESGLIKVIGSILTNKKIINGLNYIATSINPVYMKNKLKKIYYNKFIRGSNIKNINSYQNIDISSLTGSNYTYRCNNNEILIIKGYPIKNINIYTLGCKINIDQNIKSNGGYLNIYAFSNNKNPDLEKIEGWDIAGNIYIKSSVKTIIASLFAEGSIFTYKDSINKDNIFLDRVNNNDFKSQLYIKGKIFSKNTLGGGNKYSDGTYYVVNGKKINENEKLFGNDIDTKLVAQAYDLSFLKSKFVRSDNTYDTGNISEIIKNKYNCSGDKNNDKEICYTVLIIEDTKK